MSLKGTGRFLGMPYDWRRPTLKRLKSRLWNPEAKLFTPKVYGLGWDINFYRLLHPATWTRRKK